MEELLTGKQEEQYVIDSREVAEMIGKSHAHLLRDIDRYISVIETNPKLDSSNYFIKSNYKGGNNQIRPCYLLKKQGCELVANKLTGDKGILFTATYVSKFNEMEAKEEQHKLPTTYVEALLALVEAENVKEEQEKQLVEKDKQIEELEPDAHYTRKVLQADGAMNTGQIANDYGISAQQLNKILNELRVQYKSGTQWITYAKYRDKGYTESVTYLDVKSRAHPHTKWTQKGRLFIYDLLKNEKNMLPIIEQDERKHAFGETKILSIVK